MGNIKKQSRVKPFHRALLMLAVLFCASIVLTACGLDKDLWIYEDYLSGIEFTGRYTSVELTPFAVLSNDYDGYTSSRLKQYIEKRYRKQ